MAIVGSKTQCLTLNLVWDQYVKERAVHFLKIDVEGFEKLVLRGNDWSRHRPWIVLADLAHAQAALDQAKQQLDQERTLRTKAEARLAELELQLVK